MTDTRHVGTDLEPSEGYLQPSRVRVHYRCDVCGHEWSKVFRAVPKKDPACPMPACVAVSTAEAELRAAERMEQILESRIPPGHIGESKVVKAVDETARIVMEDYGMTDLKDNIREGEGAAPKLPPAQQAAADGFFSTKKFAENAGVEHKRAELLKRRAIAGAFRGMSVNPNVSSFGRKAGEAPLSVARIEKIGSERQS
jgi:hypothetical protein